MSFGVRVPCPECGRSVGLSGLPGDTVASVVNHGDERKPLEQGRWVIGRRRRPTCAGTGREVPVPAP